MRLKLDENLSRYLKNQLQTYNHEIETTADENLLFQSDEIIAQTSKEEERMIFSLDTDFADIGKYPPGNHPGIVVFRPRSFGPLSVNHFVENFVKNTDLEKLSGCIVIVEPGRMRIRRPV